jgi:hypothetical protein
MARAMLSIVQPYYGGDIENQSAACMLVQVRLSIRLCESAHRVAFYSDQEYDVFYYRFLQKERFA